MARCKVFYEKFLRIDEIYLQFFTKDFESIFSVKI